MNEALGMTVNEYTIETEARKNPNTRSRPLRRSSPSPCATVVS